MSDDYARTRKTTVTLDPQGCGCTDCITGYSINPDQLGRETVIGLMQLDLTLDNRSSGKLTFTIEQASTRHNDENRPFDVFLMDPWRDVKTGLSWRIDRADLHIPISRLALSFDEDGLVLG